MQCIETGKAKREPTNPLPKFVPVTLLFKEIASADLEFRPRTLTVVVASRTVEHSAT